MTDLSEIRGLPFSSADAFAVKHEAMKEFCNQLSGLRAHYSQKLHVQSKRELSTADNRRYAMQEYLAICTLYHLVCYVRDSAEKMGSDLPYVAFEELLLMNAFERTVPKKWAEAVREAHRQGLNDLYAHEGARIHLDRRNMMIGGVAAGMAALGAFAHKTAQDITRSVDRQEGPSPDKTFSANLAMSGCAAGVAWHSAAIVLDRIPNLSEYWQQFCQKTGMPEPALKQIARAIDLVVLSQQKSLAEWER